MNHWAKSCENANEGVEHTVTRARKYTLDTVQGRIVRLISTLLLATATCAWAASPIPPVDADDTVSSAEIKAAIETVGSRQDLDEETRAKVIDQLRDASAQLTRKSAAEAAARAATQALEAAPAETNAIRAALDEPLLPPTAETLGVGEDTLFADLEQMLVRELAGLTNAQAQLIELDAALEAEEDRPAKARERDGLRRTREELTAAMTAGPLPGEPALLAEARRLATQLRRDAVNAEMNRLEQELLSQGVRLTLLQAQRDAAARALAHQRQRTDLIQALVNERRQAAATAAQQEADLAELAAADKHPVVRSLAQANAELTRELPSAAADIQRITDETTSIDDQAQQIEENLARSRQRLEVGGVSQAIGRLFLEERANLPRVSQYRAAVRERGALLSKIGLAQVRIVDERRELTSIETAVDRTMEEIAVEVTEPGELETIREQVERLLRDRRNLLIQAASAYTSYLRVLSDLDVAQRRLLDAADEYKQFLDEHLLWIPSTTLFGLDSVRDLAPAVRWTLSPRSWKDAATAFLEALRQHPFYAVVAILLVALAFSMRRPLNRWLKSLSAQVGNLSTDHIGLTLGALAISAARAVPWPLTLVVIAAALEVSPLRSEFAAALAGALVAIVPFLYNTLLFRILCEKDGVMRVHFQWSEQGLAIIRRQLHRLTAIAVPIASVAALAYRAPLPAYQGSLARLMFVILMIVFSLVARPLLHPTSGVVANYYRLHPRTWRARLRRLWYAIAVGGPVALGLAALAGYLHTAVILTGLLVDTLWLLLVLVVLNLIVLRWLALARRKIAWQMTLEKREPRPAESDAMKPEGEGEIPVVEKKPLDLDAVDQQTRRLLQAGLLFVGVIGAWGIWAEILPALNILEQVSVWSKTVTVDGQETIAPVTLADLLLALIIVLVTAVAARNLPGLTEIVVLQRLTLQPGSRYAINTLLRYVVVTIGVIAVLNIIGWNWSRIQWLVAALSVGLGFGLQEIVANFVSGLVILFERPVRVGDTVTVGELTGTVSRVRIRATTITDWDRKEIIVPNKSFITEQVINWTLSDPITRIVIPVGVSYGSDVQLATRVMQDTLNALPLVLDDPAPSVYFIGFGESSLDFNLYLFSRQLADRLPLMHAVHETVLAALHEHGIEIPFPQRDLHVRSIAEEAGELMVAPREKKE